MTDTQTAGDTAKKDVTTVNAATETNDKKPDGEAMVPSFRLKEESDKRRQIEQEKEALSKKLEEYESSKKKDEEKKLAEQWEYKTLVEQKEAELQSLSWQLSSYKEKEAYVQELVDSRFESLKTQYGEDTVKKIKEIIDSVDPFITLKKIDSVVSVLWLQSKDSTSWQIPWMQRNNTSRKAELMKKAQDGTITKVEKSELMRLAMAAK